MLADQLGERTLRLTSLIGRLVWLGECRQAASSWKARDSWRRR